MNAYKPMRLTLLRIALGAFVADNFLPMLPFIKRQPHAG
jgi:hypothetical protein